MVENKITAEDRVARRDDDGGGGGDVHGAARRVPDDQMS